MAHRSYRVFQADAFTDRIFTGNPAVVVLDADTLKDEEMQQIARKIAGGDCAFVMGPQGKDHDICVRFFTPTREVPYVGHATIAAHVVRATASNSGAQRVRQLSGIGVVEVDVQRSAGIYQIAVRQPAAKHLRTLGHEETEALLDALAAGSSDLDPRCPLEVYALRATRLLVGMRSSAALTQMKPDFAALARLTPHLGADGYFLFTLASEVSGCLTEARMFCPAIGIPEDAVSGNAHGMLGAYLVRHRLLPVTGGKASFSGAQGAAMGRPGLVHVQIEATNDSPSAVRIAGSAVIVFSTTISL